MKREDIIQNIENLIYLLNQKEDIKKHKKDLENKGLGMIKFFMISSIFIYPIGIMLYLNGEGLASAASLMGSINIEKEVLSFDSLNFMIIWTLIFLVGIAIKVCINTFSIPYIKNCAERLRLIEQNISENLMIDNMDLYNYCNSNALNCFREYLESGRADNLKECMNYYSLESHLNNLENHVVNIGKVRKA